MLEQDVIFVIGSITNMELKLLVDWLACYGYDTRHIDKLKKVPRNKNALHRKTLRGVITLNDVTLNKEATDRLVSLLPAGAGLNVYSTQNKELTSQDLKNVAKFLTTSNQ